MARGEVRIIAGKWRGRKVIVPDLPGLRPTPDRVRETLFNWLMPIIEDTTCLDLFAGSGVLGLEALSRGAKHVTFVDKSKVVLEKLNSELKRFGADNVDLYSACVPEELKLPKCLYNLVFLDPPFDDDLLIPTCFYLEEKNFLSANAYIYLESKIELKKIDLPQNWELVKTKKAGQVQFYLAQRR